MRYCIILLLLPFMLISQTAFDETEALFEQKKFSKAEALMTTYVQDNPNDVKGIELLGDAFGHQKKWDDAIIYYRKLVDLNPKVANYHYKLGGALGMKALSISKLKALGIIGDVKEAFLMAAELDPTHIDARWALVELYMQLPGIVGGSKKKSFMYANELEALSQVDGYLAKGYIYEYDDEPELAEKFYKQAIQEGGSLTCYSKLTELYETQKEPNKAIQNIEATQEKHKRNALHYQIGKVCADYNIQLDKGEQCLKTYIQNHSAKDGVPLSWAYYRMAQIYKHRHKKEEALSWIDKAIAQKDLKPFRKERDKILQL